tara:strand:+ start:34 stop:330 length:297 start_codon:yes stop_codon:yes gene_type:complete
MSRATQTLQDVIAISLEKGLGIKPAAAGALAEAILLNASRLGLGGDDYYIPAMHASARRVRNERIRAEFNGRNLTLICRRYGVSARTVYRVVRRNEAA